MATIQAKRQMLRDILAGAGGEVAPAAYDPLSAMLIERAGFRVVSIANGPLAHSFGLPDVGIVTITEQVAHATLIADSISIPLIVDCEMPPSRANVARAAREFER